VEFEFTFQDGDGPADVEMALGGAPTAEGFRRMNQRLEADPRFRAGLTMLVDCSALDPSGLSEEELQNLSEQIVERDWHYAPSAVAIVAPGEQTLRAARAYRAHVGGSKSNRHLFGSRAEAIAWLEHQGS
jgi:hypothetical protein